MNPDAVIRTVYHKYHHPKEVLISNGVVNKEIARMVRGDAVARPLKSWVGVSDYQWR